VTEPREDDTSAVDDSLVGDTSDLPDDVRDEDVLTGEDG
jgi:hypothetical protein